MFGTVIRLFFSNQLYYLYWDGDFHFIGDCRLYSLHWQMD